MQHYFLPGIWRLGSLRFESLAREYNGRLWKGLSAVSDFDLNNPLSDGFPEAAPESQGGGLRGFLIETIQTLVLALVLFGAINFLTARIRVEGHSMEPNFHHNNYVIVFRLAYQFNEIERGDVIVFPYPNNPSEDYIKRVVGLPGDRVAVQNGVLLVNGQAAYENYVAEPMRRDYPEILVPEGTVFVMGDNRNDSSDSRRWGPLPVGAILGKAVFVYWPVVDWHIVQDIPPVLLAP